MADASPIYAYFDDGMLSSIIIITAGHEIVNDISKHPLAMFVMQVWCNDQEVKFHQLRPCFAVMRNRQRQSSQQWRLRPLFQLHDCLFLITI